MKKQLLIAAVAATMTTATFADVSITGGSEVTIANSGTTVETTLGLAGKSGDTSVTIDLDLHAAQTALVKNAYMKTTVAGIAVKAGQWKSGASNLGRSSVKAGAYNLSTSMGGMKVAYEETGAGSKNSITVSGSVAGVALSHKMASEFGKEDSTETKASGSFGGVDLAYHVKDNGTDANTAISASTTVGDVKVAYTTIDVEVAMNGMDGAIGDVDGNDTKDSVAIGTHSAIALTTSIGGNTVTLKRVDLNGEDTNKIIVKRGIVKATYNDTLESIEVELAVKF
jgi:hypothetical protein